jgi:hypothetical protein
LLFATKIPQNFSDKNLISLLRNPHHILIISYYIIYQGAVIFATERTEGFLDADSVWLQVPDGYVRERGILFGALGPPSVVPFSPELHLPESQVIVILCCYGCYVLLCIMYCYVLLCIVMYCYVLLCFVMCCFVLLCIIYCYVLLCIVLCCYVLLCAVVYFMRWNI